MSGELVEKLKRRALVFLREAKRLLSDGEYGLACFNADQSLQLYLKAVILRLFGEMPRVHGVRELAGFLVRSFREAGYVGEADLLEDFVRERRYVLSVLEDAYIDARYGLRDFSREEAEESYRAAENLIELLRRIEDAVWME